MKWKNELVFLMGMVFMACGSEEKLETSGLHLVVELPQFLASEEKENLLKEIEFYRFQFSGQFPKFTEDVPRREYSQYVFSDVPFDNELNIQITAMKTIKVNEKIVEEIAICEGKIITQYYEGKKDRVVISLQLSER